ncbi:diaminopimelate epimerase [Melioribacteraceae bacterium 4301-Me]|uniref:diaminopimelate epimerase n=1 Tax=Pyranulibacter aquaticus TaxID=3163344 RepID=UPI003598E567
MKKFSFVKLQASGNDFVLFDKKLNPELSLNSQIISQICSRRFGVGADGVLVFLAKENYDFALEYYNADGSSGVLCANGARCAIKYASLMNLLKNDSAKFTVNGFDYSGSVVDDRVKFNLNKPSKIKLDFKIKAAGQLINACFVDTGAPHVVIDIKDVLESKENLRSFYRTIDNFPAFQIGREIRYSRDFSPNGTNVNFFTVADGLIYIRTYERGVEDETLSCGTGSVATAIIGYLKYNLAPPIKLKVKSNDLLEVDFSLTNEKQINNVSLTGPAVLIFNGELTI